MKAFHDIPLLEGAQPIIGHLGRLRRNRVAFVANIAERVDRMARFASPAAPGVIVNHPEVLTELLVEKARLFEKSLMTRFSLGPLGGEGLFTSRYDLWKKQRKLMAPLFQPSQLGRYAPDMVACATRGVAEWKDGEELELLRETTRITMSIAGKTLFDTDTFSEADAIGEALTTALEWAGANAPSPLAIAHLMVRAALVESGRALMEDEGRTSGFIPASHWLVDLGEKFERPLFVPGKSGRDLKHAVALLDERVQRMIDERRTRPGTTRDLMSLLLTARDEDDGTTMTDKQVRDEILTLFVAGHETTATALAWSVYCLCRHPAVYDAVQKEVDACGGAPTTDDLPKLALTLRVFKEALRLYPPVYMLARQSSEKTELDGTRIPRNAIVLFSPYALHRRRDFWPEPERFDPDRFKPEMEAKRHRLAWLPFGAGPRVCIGNHFAMMEAQLVLAKMLHHARFELVADDEPLPSATLRPKYGMRVRLHLRRNPPRRTVPGQSAVEMSSRP